MSDAQRLVCVEPNPDFRLRLEAAPRPVAKAGEVVVRVHASSVNPIDAKRAAGYGRRLLRLKGAGRFPLVLGNDMAGVVEAVGPKVKHWKVGDAVFGLTPTGPVGAHASHVAFAESLLRPMIDGKWRRSRSCGADHGSTPSFSSMRHKIQRPQRSRCSSHALASIAQWSSMATSANATFKKRLGCA